MSPFFGFMKLPMLLRLALATGFLAHTGLAQPFTISRTNYHGWADSFALNNGRVEAVVVPAVGRVMQFQLVGEEGVFWENRALDGTLFRRTKSGAEEEARALLNRR